MGKNLSDIEQYFKEVEHIYNIDFERFKKVCTIPFLFTKKIMNTGKLKSVRLKYFGTFYVSQGRVDYFRNLAEIKNKENEK